MIGSFTDLTVPETCQPSMTSSVRMPSIAFIVARSHPQHIIGCDNQLPWKLKTDLKFFRSITEHHAIIMGRKTFDSIRRPLPSRMNIVMSRQEGSGSSNLAWVKDRESALYLADHYSIMNGKRQLIVVGGEQIYNTFIDIVDRVFLTEVFTHLDKGNAFFKNDFDAREWRLIDQQEHPSTAVDEFPFRMTLYERRIKTIRQRQISDFMTDEGQSADWRNGHFDQKLEAYRSLPDEQYGLPLAAA